VPAAEEKPAQKKQEPVTPAVKPAPKGRKHKEIVAELGTVNTEIAAPDRERIAKMLGHVSLNAYVGLYAIEEESLRKVHTQVMRNFLDLEIGDGSALTCAAEATRLITRGLCQNIRDPDTEVPAIVEELGRLEEQNAYMRSCLANLLSTGGYAE
jgi:hypothetical protein